MTSAAGHSSAILHRRTPASFTLEEDGYIVYWEGLVFLNGFMSGEESIRGFIRELKRTAIEDACIPLKGTFFIAVEAKQAGQVYALVDNAGLYQAFYSANKISTSFLDLIRHEGYTVEDFDPVAVAEYLHFGHLFFHRTFFGQVRRIRGDEILSLSYANDKLRVLKKNESYFNLEGNYEKGSFDSVFDGIAKSLKNCELSVDLTGGLDSRLIAVMLDHYGLSFESASSGGTSAYEDLSISKEVAGILKHPWFSTVHSIEPLADDLRDVFIATDGLYDVVYYHRLYQLQRDRRARGVDTVISGAGGELFKDYWWLHDFPFYSMKTSDIGRLVDLRVMSFKPMKTVFAKPFAEACDGLRGSLIQKMSEYILETNTKTYDNIFFNVMMSDVAGRVLTSHGRYMKCYAPFLDFDLARIGFGLPRKERFFNMFHRKKLTALNPAVAKTRTSENGITASSRPMDMLRDLPKYGSEKLNRLLIKLGLARQKRSGYLNHPDFWGYVRGMKITGDALVLLKDAGIVDGETRLQQIEDSRLGAFLSLGMLVGHMRGYNKGYLAQAKKNSRRF